MKKNDYCIPNMNITGLQKIFRFMKLTSFLILMSVVSLFASNSYSQTKLINLNMNNTTVEKVLQNIEEQSDYNFMYSEKFIDVNRKVSVNVSNKNIDDLLSELFSGTEVTYKVKDHFILLSSPEASNENSFAMQQKSVSGKVTDETGEPLPGVTVLIKGTMQGVVTDMDGNFTISNIPLGATLQFSFVGMLTQNVLVGNQSNISVKMKPDAIGIEEVVAVGYGTQSKATLTGSISQVNGEDIMKAKPTSDAILAMQGEIPGVLVTRGNARPGNEDMDLKIRGDMSVNNISPTIIVDGIEIPEWQLSTINANDIETYSVLKDGAAAIYGTKAAGGVILITTKKGKKGTMKIDYQGDLQLNFAYDLPVARMKDWAQLWYNASTNDMIDYLDEYGDTKTAGFTGKFFSQDEFSSIIDGTMPLAPDSYFWANLNHRFADVDYYDESYGTTASYRHNISISGGSEKATYRTSLGYANERSALSEVYDGAKKYNFNTKVTYDLSDMISTEFNVAYDNRYINEPTQGIGEGLQNPPIFPVYNEYGNYYGLWGNNIVAKLHEGGRTKTTQESIRLSGTIKLDLDKYVKGLSVQYQAHITERRSDKTERETQVTLYDWDNNVYKVDPSEDGTYVELTNSKTFFQNHVVQANYKRSFGENNFSAMAAVISELTDNEKYTMKRTGMSSNDLDALNTGDVATQTNTGTSSSIGQVSYIGRVNYDYKGIYLLEAQGRRDGSSRFDPDYRWKNFLGASAGIRLSELDFIKQLNIFDNLKFRFSYGEMGSTTGIGNYDYVSTISTGTEYFGVTPAVQNTAWISSMTTTDRTWERVAKTNYGLDFMLLNNRLSGSVEYFNDKNKDMLVSVTYPSILGATAPKTNSGDFTNKGWEASVKWRDKFGEFKYTAGLSMWNSKGKVTRMEGKNAVSVGTNDIVEGKPLNAIYTYKTDGLFQSESEIVDYYNEVGFDDVADQNNMKSGTILPAYRSADRLIPGCVKRIDTSGDGKINTDDLNYYGDANPHYSFGINLGLEWRNFDFSAFFQGVGQQYIVRTGTLAYPFRSWWMAQNKSWLNETWSKYNTGADLPIVCFDGARKKWNYAQTNDVNVIKAAYLRAKAISLGYTLPESITGRAGISRLHLSVTGNDLFCISNINDGLDPEHGAAAHNGDALSFQSSLIFSVQVTF